MGAHDEEKISGSRFSLFFPSLRRYDSVPLNLRILKEFAAPAKGLEGDDTQTNGIKFIDKPLENCQMLNC
jgi:hypothetical protein